MKTTHFLLPFVHGVDTFAIEQGILLAKSHEAILVPLALIYMPEERRKKGVRLEYVQQSKDFLEAVKQKANRYGVQVERLEVFTSDVVQSIQLVASEMDCEGMLLFVGQKGGVLLQIQEIKLLMEAPVCKLYIVRLHVKARTNIFQELSWGFSHWFRERRKRGGVPRVGMPMQEQEQENLDKEVDYSFKA